MKVAFPTNSAVTSTRFPAITVPTARRVKGGRLPHGREKSQAWFVTLTRTTLRVSSGVAPTAGAAGAAAGFRAGAVAAGEPGAGAGVGGTFPGTPGLSGGGTETAGSTPWAKVAAGRINPKARAESRARERRMGN